MSDTIINLFDTLIATHRPTRTPDYIGRLFVPSVDFDSLSEIIFKVSDGAIEVSDKLIIVSVIFLNLSTCVGISEST